MPNRCPFCGAWARNLHEEATHMETKHPEIIKDRLVKAGLWDPKHDTRLHKGEPDARPARH